MRSAVWRAHALKHLCMVGRLQLTGFSTNRQVGNFPDRAVVFFSRRIIRDFHRLVSSRIGCSVWPNEHRAHISAFERNGVRNMRTAHLRKIDLAVLAGLLLLSLIVVALGARLIEAKAATASTLGAGWQCHRLLNVEVCDRIGASPPAVVPVRGVELACEEASPCGSVCHCFLRARSERRGPEGWIRPPRPPVTAGGVSLPSCGDYKPTATVGVPATTPRPVAAA